MDAANSVHRAKSSGGRRNGNAAVAVTLDPQAEVDLKKIKRKVELHVAQKQAVNTLMNAVRQTNEQHEVRKALEEVRHMDGRTVSSLISSLEWCLSDKMKRRDCYLPLFNLADTMWSPLRVEMFELLRHAVTSVVDEVFTRQSNPAGNEDALHYLIHSLGKRGVLEEEEYRQLLTCPLSTMCINWDGQCSLLEYAPATIWEEIYGNEEFTEFATTRVDHTLQYMLKIEKSQCVKRLLKLTVEMKSEDKTVEASQILGKLLQVKEFDPKKQTHRSIIAVLLQELGADPLHLFKDGDYSECIVTLATRRGLAFTDVSRELQESISPLGIGPKLEKLIRAGMSDDALVAIIRSVTEKHPTVQLSRVMKRCARMGHVSSMAELYNFNQKDVHPFITMVLGSTIQIPEEKFLQALNKMSPDPASLHSTVGGENVLHFAAAKGYTDLAKQILDRDCIDLLCQENRSCMYPIQIAEKRERFSTAEVLLRSANDRTQVLKLFKRDGEQEPRIFLCKLLKKLADWSEQQEMEGKKKQLLQFILAVLDVTVSEDHASIDHDLLEADERGYKPEHENFRAPSCYDVIAERRLMEIQEHESFSALVDRKWREYGAVLQSFPLILYLIFIALLSASLLLAARSSNPSNYSKQVDWVRLSLEVAVIMWVILDLGLKFYSNCTCLYVPKSQKNWQKIQCEWKNVLDILAILFTLLMIPLWASNSDWQWVFVALAYIFQGLRIFKYAIIVEPVGVYVEVLQLVIRRKLLWFLLLFSTVTMGGLYLGLRGEMISSGSSNPGDDPNLELKPDGTRGIYYIWLSGFTEGNVIGYYGQESLCWLGVIIYWLLLFNVAIFLPKILLAHFIGCYGDEARIARLNVKLAQTRILHSMEKSSWAKHIMKRMKSKQQSIYCCTRLLCWIIEFIERLFRNEYKQKAMKERTKESSGAGKQESNVVAGGPPLDIKDLSDVSEYLNSLKKYQLFKLGVALGLYTVPTLDNMQDSPTFLYDMLTSWLLGQDSVNKRGGHTWGALVNALRHPTVAENEVADKIQGEKCHRA